MCLRFAFLLITWVVSWLRLSWHEETWKTAEILILRQQLAILQREQVAAFLDADERPRRTSQPQSRTKIR